MHVYTHLDTFFHSHKQTQHFVGTTATLQLFVTPVHASDKNDYAQKLLIRTYIT